RRKSRSRMRPRTNRTRYLDQHQDYPDSTFLEHQCYTQVDAQSQRKDRSRSISSTKSFSLSGQTSQDTSTSTSSHLMPDPKTMTDLTMSNAPPPDHFQQNQSEDSIII